MTYSLDRLTERKYGPADFALKCIGKDLSKIGVLPLIEEQGALSTSGNFSVRQPDGFLITGSGVNKFSLQTDDIVHVRKRDGNHVLCYGKVNPSRELLIHAKIYDLMSEVNVVIHTHDALVLKYAKDLNIPTTQKYILAANETESQEIADMLATTPCINIKDHGQIIIGKTIEDALQIIAKTNEDGWKLHKSAISTP